MATGTKPHFSLRRVGAKLLLIAGTGLFVLGYAHFVEPSWIEVTHHTVPAPVDRAIRVAQLSDLHSHGKGVAELKLLVALKDERPDVIVITGDNAPNEGDPAQADAVLGELHAPLGVFMVDGNWEHWRHAPPPPPNVRVLTNEAVVLTPKVVLVGVDDSISGRPDLKKSLEDAPPDAYRLGLFHSPEFFPRAAGLPLALAGHTHGGQVRLPFIGALWLPPGSGSYDHGWYESGSSKMYVSRGIGMSIYPVRFWCRPELAIIDLVPLGGPTPQ